MALRAPGTGQTNPWRRGSRVAQTDTTQTRDTSQTQVHTYTVLAVCIVVSVLVPLRVAAPVHAVADWIGSKILSLGSFERRRFQGTCSLSMKVQAGTSMKRAKWPLQQHPHASATPSAFAAPHPGSRESDCGRLERPTIGREPLDDIRAEREESVVHVDVGPRRRFKKLEAVLAR